MARRFTDTIQVGRDPTSPLEVATKQYLDNQKAAANGLATLDASSKLPLEQLTSHAHDASDITQGTLSALRLPRAPFGTITNTTTGTGNYNLDISAVAQVPLRIKWIQLHNSGLNLPTGTPADGQIVRITCYASGGARTWTFNASFKLSTGLTTRTFNIPSGQQLFASIEYSTDMAAWTITAATVSA